MVNEITLYVTDGFECMEVLDAAFTKPFGIMPFIPDWGRTLYSPDPHYLEWKAKELNFNTHFITLAEINRRMPEFVRDKALRILNHAGIASAEARILVLGMAYKKDIKDERESPSIDVIKLLQAEGVEISYHDPFIPECNSHGVIMNSIPLTKQSITEAIWFSLPRITAVLTISGWYKMPGVCLIPAMLPGTSAKVGKR